MVVMQPNQSLKDAKTNFEKAYIEQAIEANDCRLRKASRGIGYPLFSLAHQDEAQWHQP